MQDALGGATHQPALQPTIPVRCHRDHLRFTSHSLPFNDFTLLRHPDNSCRDITIEGHEPANRGLKVCNGTDEQILTYLVRQRTEVFFRLLHNGFSLDLTEPSLIRQHHHSCEMQCALRGS